MLQRSPSSVVRIERVRGAVASGGYSEEGLSSATGPSGPLDAVSLADLRGESAPHALRVRGSKAFVEWLKLQDADYYERLEKAGWRQDWGEDGTGPFLMFPRTFRGYYFDVGASQMIADGRIGLRSGAEIAEVRPRSVLLTDGTTELPCDLLVCATGFRNMQDRVAEIVSPATAQALGPCWGLGSGVKGDPGPWEGELRNMWKPTCQEGLWLHGGNISLSRFFSLHLALQLKARHDGLPVEVYPRPRRRQPSGAGSPAADVLPFASAKHPLPRL